MESTGAVGGQEALATGRDGDQTNFEDRTKHPDAEGLPVILAATPAEDEEVLNGKTSI